MNRGLWTSLQAGGACTAIAAALGIVALGAATPASAQSGAFVINGATAPSTLDPAWACGLDEIGFLQNFYVRLTQNGSKPAEGGTSQSDPAKIEPYLAKSWTISDDGKTYTFKLDTRYKFASGKPVDAAAVKYTFERGLKMAGCGRYFLTDGFLDPPLIQAIDTPDPATVVIHLAHPNANVLVDWSTPAASIVDPAVVEANGGVEAGKPNTWMSSHVAGSGPFRLDAYSPNQSAKLSANPDFPEAPASKTLEVNWISAAPTLLLQARSGKADVTLGLAKQAANTLKSNAAARVLAYSNPFVQQVMLPNSKGPWTNVKVREAVAHAVPYEDIVKKIAFGAGTLYYGPLPPSLPGFNAELSKPLSFDLALSKRLIGESGLPTPIPVEMMIQEGDAAQAQLGAVLQSTWKQIGIDLKLHITPASEFQDLSQGHKAQSLMRLDGPGVFEAGYYLGYDMICGSGFNLTEVCIPEADKALSELRATLDPAKRQILIDKITTLWRAQFPKILFYEDRPLIVLGKDVKSFRFSPVADFRTWGK